MLNSVKLIAAVSFAIVLSASAGCGDNGAADLVLKRRSNLRLLGAAYREYFDINQRTASDAAELLEFLRKKDENAELQNAITSLEEGDVVLVWNGQVTSGVNGRVLGFEAGVPSTGGYVVMGDGSVRLMTAKDFSKSELLEVDSTEPNPEA